MQRIEVRPSMAKFRAALKKAGNDFPKKLQKVNKEVAKTVADDTREAYGNYYQRQSGAGERSIRALATQLKAQVAIGNTKAPYVPGQNFGSNRIRRFAPKAHPDRFLYKSVEKRRAKIIEEHSEMVRDLLHEAYPE